MELEEIDFRSRDGICYRKSILGIEENPDVRWDFYKGDME